MHVAAVGADRTAEPVRSFGTFTADLHRLVDWFAECDVETVDQCLPDPDFRTARGTRVCGIPRQCTRCQACAGTQDGRERRTVAAAAPFSWVAACQLPPQGGDR
jgi:transposase